MLQNEHALEVTRQRIPAFQDALLALRRTSLLGNYPHIAQNFLYDIRKMEADVHAYLQHCPAPENPAVKLPV